MLEANKKQGEMLWGKHMRVISRPICVGILMSEVLKLSLRLYWEA